MSVDKTRDEHRPHGSKGSSLRHEFASQDATLSNTPALTPIASNLLFEKIQKQHNRTKREQ